MNHTHPKQLRLLAIAPSSRGFGFVVLEGEKSLVNWGVRTVKKDKNIQSLKKVTELITDYRPGLLVLQDMADAHRAPRIKALNQRLIALAETRKLKVKLIRDQQVKRVFFGDGKGTKQERAEIIAARFPDELGFRLPSQRRAWESEDGRMCMFDAVALALACWHKKK